MKVNSMRLMIVIAVMSLIVFVKSASAAVINVPADFTTIQAAISSASPGDTINVAAGTYDENLDINVNVSIEGAGSGTDPLVDTIIDPSGGTYGMYIHQPVNLKNLRVTGAPGSGIRVEPKGSPLIFSNVTWQNIASSANGGRGVELHNGTQITNMAVTNCEFVDNTRQGIRASSGTPIDGLVITDSKFDLNQYAGIYLQNNTSNVTILRSTFDDNKYYGAYMSEYGLMENITIEDSSFNGNGYWGIDLWSGHVAGINGFSITGTSIDDNGLGAWIGASVISDFLIECSSVVNNTFGSKNYYEGIEFNYGTLTNVVVRNTNIYGNLGEGLANYGKGTVDATNNWWGDTSGPAGAGSGSGDAVTTNVGFNDWLTNPADCDAQQIHQVNLDIKPQSCPNPLNVKSKGVLPVAILGTEDFDVSSIDVATLTINGVEPVRNSIEDVTTPSIFEPCGCEGLGPDTISDLTLKFDRQAIIATLGEVGNGDEILLTIIGALLDGTAIEGSDCIVINGVKKAK